MMSRVVCVRVKTCARVFACVCQTTPNKRRDEDTNWNSFSHVWQSAGCVSGTYTYKYTHIFALALALIKVGFAIWKPCATLASLRLSMCMMCMMCLSSSLVQLHIPTDTQIHANTRRLCEDAQVIKINLWPLHSQTCLLSDPLKMYKKFLFWTWNTEFSELWGRLWAGKRGVNVLFFSQYCQCALKRCSYSELRGDQRTLADLDNFQMCLKTR